MRSRYGFIGLASLLSMFAISPAMAQQADQIQTALNAAYTKYKDSKDGKGLQEPPPRFLRPCRP